MLNNSVLLQIHTRIWVNEIRSKIAPENKHFTLDDIPVSEWQAFKKQGFDIIYLLGVWEVDTLTEDIFKKKNLQHEFDEVLSDWSWEDTCGSPFSIRKYEINPALGNENTLKNLKNVLNGIGLELVLDFVPNHFGLTTEYIAIPNLFMEEKNFSTSTRDYEVYTTSQGKKAIYHGKDPYFPPWEDTLQLDYSSKITKEFMKNQLLVIAEVCDGVRCDMAMLMVNRIIQQSWGSKMHEQLNTEFWSDTINDVKSKNPNFTFIAEVYWDMEEELLNLGFDYCYDKKLYDAIRDRNYGSFEYILSKNQHFQNTTVRFLENHDEPRSTKTFTTDINFLAMITTFTLPGIKFFHDKQLEGYTKKSSLFLTRRAKEKVNSNIKQQYLNFFDLFFQRFLKMGYNTWNPYPDVFKKDLEFGKNIYWWGWNNSSGNSLVIIINFKNIGTLIELNDKIQEINLLLDSETFMKKRIERGENSKMIFELNPNKALIFSSIHRL